MATKNISKSEGRDTPIYGDAKLSTTKENAATEMQSVLSSPLAVDPLSQQLIDSRWVLLMTNHKSVYFSSGRIRIFHGVNFVRKAPPWQVFLISWNNFFYQILILIMGFWLDQHKTYQTLLGIGLSCWRSPLPVTSTHGVSTLWVHVFPSRATAQYLIHEPRRCDWVWCGLVWNLLRERMTENTWQFSARS